MLAIEIKVEGDFYCGYYYGKPITKQKSLRKAIQKIDKYLKSQGE